MRPTIVQEMLLLLPVSPNDSALPMATSQMLTPTHVSINSTELQACGTVDNRSLVMVTFAAAAALIHPVRQHP